MGISALSGRSHSSLQGNRGFDQVRQSFEDLGRALESSSHSSGASGSSGSNTVYDAKDTNKDGTVSWREEQDYRLKHPEESTQTSTTFELDSDRGAIDALA